MIKIEQCRIKDGHKTLMPPKQRTSLEALSHMLEYEFGYGGTAHEVTETSVTVATAIAGCVDTTKFTGNEEEMASLILAAKLLEASMQIDSSNADTTETQLVEEPEAITHQHLFIMKNLRKILVGQKRLKIIMMLAQGVEDEASIKAGIMLNMEDLAAALQLFEDKTTTFDTLLGQL